MQIKQYLDSQLNLDNKKSKITNITRGAIPLVIDYLCKKYNKSILILTTDPMMTSHLERELPFYNPEINFLPFPDWETLPYDSFSPNDEIISQRIETLYKLSLVDKAVTCIPLTTALHRLCPVEFIKQHSLDIKINDLFDLSKIKTQLVEYGYTNVAEVHHHGEFSIKGSLIDLYPMGSDLPYRIDLFDNEIDSIRTFDPENQRSIEKIEAIRLLPAHEFSFTQDSIKTFRNNWRDLFTGNPLNAHIYQDISNEVIPSGIEYFIPLFYNQMASIFDYLAKDSIVITLNSSNDNTPTLNYLDDFISITKSRYTNYNIDTNNPLLPPDKLFLQPEGFFQTLNDFKTIELSTSVTETVKSWHNKLTIKHTPNITIDRHLKDPLVNLKNYLINDKKVKVLILAESAGRRENILDLLKQHSIKDINLLSNDDPWQDFLKSNSCLNIGLGKLDNGFYLETDEDTHLCVISEAELYGNQVQQRRLRKHKDISTENVIKNLAELKPNQLVVHQQHGVAKYLGLESIAVNNITNEYLCLLYANNSKLYVPATSLELISRYSGITDEDIPLSYLGSKSWSQAKQKAFKKIKDTAAELLTIYAKRESSTGYKYKINTEDYAKFCANFNFEETPDQELAIRQVLADMEKSTSMDRLVCGDVGFGKTEVALRAAFIASMSNKQVAVLVPTTLLAQQHYENFKDRFADFPINIELLSRFRTAKQTQENIANIEAGKIDIVIGTHKLLQESIKFKDLGLLVIDEEHRFGVKQKEKIKKLRANVDILTLTATPIPRTLNLSLTGIRDLSIITTPPQKRLAIKTFLRERSKDLIQEAITREIKRGGQVYFLHNDIKTIHNVFDEVTELFPDTKTAVAHGQMRERELEKIMSDFYHRKFQILICTTIIETGIDIPSANTILIDRADRLGLAQLHQLRGRVGRSHHQAYAYLFTPRGAKITDDAKKRLDAITSLENLGAGFTLASHDMEIRGTGNLLGEEQSGHIEAIGYSLYMDLLSKAVEELKSGKILDLDQLDNKFCEVDLHVSALLPEDYIHDVNQRLILYKRISEAENDTKLESIKLELKDRFGKLPIEVENLFIASKIKLKANNFNITKIDIGTKSGKIKFAENPNIDQLKLIQLIQQQTNKYKLASNNILNFYAPMENITEKYNIITILLDKIAI